MGADRASKVERAARWATIVAPFLMVATCLLMALGWYVINVEWRTWVDWWVEWWVGRVGMLAAVGIAVVLVVGICWVLVRLGRCAVRWSSRAREPWKDDREPRIPDVDSEALLVLLAALIQYDASASENVVVIPGDLRFGRGTKRIQSSVATLRRGSAVLRRAGFVESWTGWEAEGIRGVEVTLGERCIPRRVAREICLEIERVLVERGVWDEGAEKARPSNAESAIEGVSSLGVRILQVSLSHYERYHGGPAKVRLPLVFPDWSSLPRELRWERVEKACRRLACGGLVDQWEPTGAGGTIKVWLSALALGLNSDRALSRAARKELELREAVTKD